MYFSKFCSAGDRMKSNFDQNNNNNNDYDDGANVIISEQDTADKLYEHVAGHDKKSHYFAMYIIHLKFLSI